jgi:branched-chain amino acid aminotransferase
MQPTITIRPQTERAVTETRSLPFGKIPAEHQFIAEYRDGAWGNARIEPFADLQLSPFTLALHYGQTVFEGMKAFRMSDGRISLFRPEKHYERFCLSLDRMCMPAMRRELFLEALDTLVNLDKDWVPTDADGSLYIRPFVIATEPRLGVKVSDEYLFMIVTTPAYAYYSAPLNVKVETDFSRAASGGTGFAKCGGNYGGAFYPTQKARAEGFDQVLWTDAGTHEFLEESGTMNLMFCVDGTILTPPLSDTLLDGVTRSSLLQIAKDLELPAEVRPIRWRELQEAFEAGKKVEAFGAGTAAVIAPFASITIEGRAYTCYTGEDAVMYKLRDALHDIRVGAAPDRHGWNRIL